MNSGSDLKTVPGELNDELNHWSWKRHRELLTSYGTG